MKDRKHSKIYRHIEALQGSRSWGALLDAGTGIKSIQWISDLDTQRWTAVTGASNYARQVEEATQGGKRPQDKIILGNWADPRLLNNEVYDTVIADYLLGAVEGFAPYFQTYLFARLRPLTKEVLYVTGLEPYVPATQPESRAERIVWEMGRFRDSCVLLSGGMPYREYPAPWVVDQLKRSGFSVKNIKHFRSGYKEKFISAQINIAKRSIGKIADSGLAQALNLRAEALLAEAMDVIREEGALRCLRNYVVAAEPV